MVPSEYSTNDLWVFDCLFLPIGVILGIAFTIAAFALFWPLVILAIWIDLIFLGAYFVWRKNRRAQIAEAQQQMQSLLNRPAQEP